MKTRSGSDYSLRGLCVGALSAASIVLLGLALTQQSPTKLATADTPLSLSARTALGGPGDEGAAKSGSTDHGSMEMVVVAPDFSDSFENKAYDESKVHVKLVSAQYILGELGQGALSKGRPPVNICDKTKSMLESGLNQLKLTDEQRAIIYGSEKIVNLSTFDCFDPESEPMTEDEVVKLIGDDESVYAELLKILFVDLVYSTRRRLLKEGKSGTFLVERPKTMLALFRSLPLARLIIFTLPYRIDSIAAHFFFTANFYSYNIVEALPKLQKTKPAPIPFIYMAATKDRLVCAEVKHDEEIAVTKDEQLVTESSHVSNAEELSQVIKRLKMQAKIPDYHELVIAQVTLLHPVTEAERTVLCSDVGVGESLQNQVGHLNDDENLGFNTQIARVDAIFVERNYSHLMKDHIVEAYNLLETHRLLDEHLIDQSALLLDDMKGGFRAVADNQ